MEDELELGYLDWKWTLDYSKQRISCSSSKYATRPINWPDYRQKVYRDSFRKFIFRSDEYNETQNVPNGDDFQPQPQIGLPYNEKFVSGDPTRQPETKPGGVTVQEQKDEEIKKPKDKEIEMTDYDFTETLEYKS